MDALGPWSQGQLLTFTRSVVSSWPRKWGRVAEYIGGLYGHSHLWDSSSASSERVSPVLLPQKSSDSQGLSMTPGGTGPGEQGGSMTHHEVGSQPGPGGRRTGSK